MSEKVEATVEKLIFLSRWLGLPVYLGLSVAGVAYMVKFVAEVGQLIFSTGQLSEREFLLGVLTLIDMTLVANLLITVILGGFSTFVNRLQVKNAKNKPSWLRHMDTETLKVNLLSSLVGISGVHLLKLFFEIPNQNFDAIKMHVFVFITFVGATLLLSITAWIMKQKDLADIER